MFPYPLRRLSQGSVSALVFFPVTSKDEIIILTSPLRAKKKNYPNGYPGDAPSSDTSKPVKYTCHLCTKPFPLAPHPDSTEGKAESQGTRPECVRCGHERCEKCPRARPRKVEPDPDPEIMRMVEAKLAELNIDTRRTAAAAVATVK